MPDFGFVFLIAGVLLVYCELIWLGKIVFGLMGAIMTLTGFSILARVPHTSVGMILIGASVLFFAAEAMVGKTFYLAGLLATALLAAGFWRFGVSAQLAFPVCIVFGAITTALLSIAKQARVNKQA